MLRRFLQRFKRDSQGPPGTVHEDAAEERTEPSGRFGRRRFRQDGLPPTVSGDDYPFAEHSDEMQEMRWRWRMYGG